MLLKTFFAAAALSNILVQAHPGEHHERDIEGANYRSHIRRGISSCAGKLAARGIHARAHARRKAYIAEHAKRAALVGRDDSVLGTSHASNASYTTSTPDSTIFSSNSSCALNPQGETGPYYVLGELIRKNIVDDEPGVPVYLEAQFVDVETCEPVTDMYLDIWSCNSTGVYSGLSAQGNGNADDTSNLNNTALRGVQPTDDDGVVAFQTIFPGHYSGRTTHIHMVAHLEATLNDNNTLSGGTVPQIGQFFFDQDLITEVEALSPYSANTQSLTTNAEDHVVSDEITDTTTDPILNYVRLGDDLLTDGLLTWITVGINTSATYDPNYSWAWTSDGSVADEHGSTGGPGGSPGSGNGTVSGGPGGNGTMSGAPPSGSPPTASGSVSGGAASSGSTSVIASVTDAAISATATAATSSSSAATTSAFLDSSPMLASSGSGLVSAPSALSSSGGDDSGSIGSSSIASNQDGSGNGGGVSRTSSAPSGTPSGTPPFCAPCSCSEGARLSSRSGRPTGTAPAGSRRPSGAPRPSGAAHASGARRLSGAPHGSGPASAGPSGRPARSTDDCPPCEC